MTECRGCGALIRFVQSTKSGKAIPVDPERVVVWLVEGPGPGKRITVVEEGGGVVSGIEGSAITPGSREVRGYVSHFATCSKAGDFRRR